MKEGALHREWSLWNQLMLSQVKDFNSSDPAISEKGESEKADGASPSTLDTPYVSLNEKTEHSDKPHRVGSGLKWTIVKILICLKLFYLIYLALSRNDRPHHQCYLSAKNADAEGKFALKNYQSFVDPSLAHPYSNSSEEVHEVIDIPLFPPMNTSAPVYSQVLLEHTFASSWNKPVLVKYTPPPANISYDSIVLTLDTVVQGVQYDRLVQIYLNNNEIWRSSTIEPAGQLSHSYAEKDVTMYLSLFNETSDLLVQLDNLVTPKLTGAFNVSISALYFSNELSADDDNDAAENGEHEIYTHPNFVPLTASKYGKHVPPLVYYPDSDLSLSLPSVNSNTTKLMLLLTTSGNAAEEFWYSNLLDPYKDSFLSHKRHFYGHGSCRVINVYVNGIRVHSTNPKPYIFSGGIAPSFWNSIVSTGSFDLMPYHIDLTPIIPLLWDSSAVLDIDISNCIDDDDATVAKSGIGSNWISSASLAVWEDQSIVDSYGDLEMVDNSTSIKSFAVNPPFSGMLTQIIKASYSNTFRTNITHIHEDDSITSNFLAFENSVNQTSILVVTKFGDSQALISIPKSNTSFGVVDPITLETSNYLTVLSNDSISSNLKFLAPSKSAPDSSDITYNVNLTTKFGFGVYSGLTPLLEIKSKENGTADFTISQTGNHGSGTMLHNYTLTNIDGLTYNRVALAENSTIAFDNVTETPASFVAQEEEIPSYFSSSFFAMADIDWLSSEEIYELHKVLDQDEISQLIDALLEESFTF